MNSQTPGAAQAVELAHRDYPAAGKPVLIILHGLLGSSRNWTQVARDLNPAFALYALDLRNHGLSPHSPVMDYPALCADLAAFIERQQLPSVHLLGHSLGGKVAMRFAQDYPEHCATLMVADIAPRDYGLHFQEAFEAMLALDLNTLPNRKAADEALSAAIPDWAFRQFLLTNLERKPDGSLQWIVNLPVLAQSLSTIRANPLRVDEVCRLPTLFLTGERSDFVQPEDHAAIQHHFPQARIVSIPGAGHNLHADNRPEFTRAIQRFLNAD